MLFVLLFLVIVSMMISSILFLVMFFMSTKLASVNKMLSFECGFVCSGVIFSSFSIHFFVVLLMFVIFDMEIILLLGCLVSSSVLSFLFLISLIIIGVYLEWYLGKLKWIV